MKCTIRDDCNTISCSAEPEGEAVTLSLKFDTSQDSATVSIRVPSRDYDWSRTFKSGEKIHVPGFPLSIKGLADADLYLMFTGNWAIDFKVMFIDLYTAQLPCRTISRKQPPLLSDPFFFQNTKFCNQPPLMSDQNHFQC